MITNTKQNATLQEKINFLLLTYTILLLLWFASALLAAYLTPVLKTNSFIQTVVNFDIYKIIIIFLTLFLLGKYLEKQFITHSIPILVLRFIAITLIIVSINIRWNIDPYHSEYFMYIGEIVLITIVAQLLRILLLTYVHKKNNLLKKYEKGITTSIFSLLIGLVVYLVFTITERVNQNTTVLMIDELLVTYLKYPLLLLAFSADNAFSKERSTAKSLPYDLYDAKISEPIKAASGRLRFFLFVYFLIAGSILSDAMLRNVL
ncbi:hypothetical protein [Aquimarina aggregata]|uniref:hypothetical protein n=1 Tax=Aquimarina aggregata TaxID=1642818 RepID=UPI002491E70C|nr:hypothetical protein [Aquimarina aggregata]